MACQQQGGLVACPPEAVCSLLKHVAGPILRQYLQRRGVNRDERLNLHSRRSARQERGGTSRSVGGGGARGSRPQGWPWAGEAGVAMGM